MRSVVDHEHEGGGCLTADEERDLILSEKISWFMDEFPDHELSGWVLALLDVTLTDAHQRALFDLCPRLKYSGKLLPFKSPRKKL